MFVTLPARSRVEGIGTPLPMLSSCAGIVKRKYLLNIRRFEVVLHPPNILLWYHGCRRKLALPKARKRRRRCAVSPPRKTDSDPSVPETWMDLKVEKIGI